MTDGNGSALKGLAAYRARREEADRRAAERTKPKVQKFALEKDGDSAIVRFGQEIDFDAKHATDKIGYVNVEHVNPDQQNGWKNRGNCTQESQGACYPDELVRDETVEWNDRKGWKQKEMFRINVIGGEPREVVEKVNGKERTKNYATDVDVKTGDGTVYLLEQGTFNGIYDALAEMAADDETITEHYYKIKRKGSEWNNTSYLITKGKEIPKDAKDVADFEFYDIDEQVPEIPYAQQKAFYWNGVDRSDVVSPVAEEKELVGSGSKTGTTDGW